MSARGANCVRDVIRSVSDDGAIIETNSGKWFTVLAQDFIDPRSWHSGDHITICINTHSAMRTYRIRNDRNYEFLVVAIRKTSK